MHRKLIGNMVQKEETQRNTFRRMSAEDEEMFMKPSSNPSSPSRSEVSENRCLSVYVLFVRKEKSNFFS